MNKQIMPVLLADDSDDDRLLFAIELKKFPALQLAGTTHDGFDTIAWLNATPPFNNRHTYPFPALLMLDYQMPGCSGLDVLDWLHQQKHQLQVILWSHAPDLIDRARAYQLGAAIVCRKPDSRSQMSAILTHVFPNSIFSPAPVQGVIPNAAVFQPN
jgi:CheY-like chemotaxis protein